MYKGKMHKYAAVVSIIYCNFIIADFWARVKPAGCHAAKKKRKRMAKSKGL